MHRILGALLLCAGADGLFLAPWTAVTSGANPTVANSTDANSAQAGSYSQRVPVCRFCQKLCPISCFVGTCGLHLASSVKKYESSNQCYSCDPAVSVGINTEGDYLKCEAQESGMVTTKTGASVSPYTQQQTIQQGPQGPAVPGNAGLSALKASKEAQLAVNAATKAAIFADQAAEAATAKYRQVTVSGGGGGGGNAYSDGQAVTSTVDQAANHQIATQIRVEECLQVAEAEHTSWKTAMGKYNQEIEKLRRQQLLVDMAEKTVEAAEAASEKARGTCATYQAAAQRAVEEAMKAGGPLSTRILSQAASEELAGAATAAHRRLVMAAKEAKEATQKLAIASAMAPCATPGGPASTAPGPWPSVPANASAPSAARTGATPTAVPQVQAHFVKALMQVPHNAPMPPVAPASFAMASFAGLVGAAENAGLDEPALPMEEQLKMKEGAAEIAGFDESALPMEEQLKMPSVAQEMSTSIVNKLTDNPAAVNDASLFALPTAPFSSDQAPGDGMTLQPMSPTDNLVSPEEASTDPSLLTVPTASVDRTTQQLLSAAGDSSMFATPVAAFSPEQVPVDGMMQTPGFDLSTISALQKSERRLLRQGGAHH